MNRIAGRDFPQQATVGRAGDAAGAFRPPVLDQAVIDFYLRRGRAERARAFAEMIRSVLSTPGSRRSAEVHALPARRQDELPGDAERTDRAA